MHRRKNGGNTNKFGGSFYCSCWPMCLSTVTAVAIASATDLVCCTVSILIKKYRHNIFISMHKSIKYDVNNSLEWIEMIGWHSNRFTKTRYISHIVQFCSRCILCILAFAGKHEQTKKKGPKNIGEWQRKQTNETNREKNNKMHFQCAQCNSTHSDMKMDVRKHLVECKWLHTCIPRKIR